MKKYVIAIRGDNDALHVEALKAAVEAVERVNHAADGGRQYLRRSFKLPHDYEELSEYIDDEGVTRRTPQPEDIA